MTDTSSNTPEPALIDNHLPHGGPPDMVPFESPSHWERLVLAIAVVGTLILAGLAGFGAIRRGDGVDLPSANVTSQGSSSTNR